MRMYLFGTGIFGVFTGGRPLLRALRNDAPFTWRVALGMGELGHHRSPWRSVPWSTSATPHGHQVPADSPVAGHEAKILSWMKR